MPGPISSGNLSDKLFPLNGGQLKTEIKYISMHTFSLVNAIAIYGKVCKDHVVSDVSVPLISHTCYSQWLQAQFFFLSWL